jgi:hypothetical protein
VPLTDTHYFKGPVWAFFERVFSTRSLPDRYDNKLRILDALHRSRRFTDFERGSPLSPEQVAALKEHINRDWFGLTRDLDGRWLDGPTPDPARPGTLSSTGAWRGWCGDAEGITREAVLRSIELSLGVAHLPWTGKRTDALREYGLACRPRGNWPIEFWCVTIPVFQAAITWRDAQPEGRVSLTWLVPSAGQAYLADLSAPGEGWEVGPANARERYGQWLVGQEQTVPAPTLGADAVLRVSQGPIAVIGRRGR